jgi:cell division protein FtsL
MWWWVLIWALLVLLAVGYLASRAWGVWGQVKELNAEVRRASATVAALETQVERLQQPAPVPDILGDPRQLRRERDLTRAALRQQRRARQSARRPTWARHLD